MAARHVLIRRLASVETLGCATVICTDKTGTLTTGMMAVRELWGPNHERLLVAAASCCDAELSSDERAGLGDPTEVAILVAAAERGIRRSRHRAAPPARARASVRNEPPPDVDRPGGRVHLREGRLRHAAAPVRGGHRRRARSPRADGGARPASAGRRSRPGLDEQRLEMLGLLGIADPPRTEAIEAVAAARTAGVTTVMITGDHAVTARAVARELGSSGRARRPRCACTPARRPKDKLAIVRAWKGRGAVVAMTGDGVNDAPALPRSPHRHRHGPNRNRGHARSLGHDPHRRQLRQHRVGHP
jgi:Ca2+-transporting ATPase